MRIKLILVLLGLAISFHPITASAAINANKSPNNAAKGKIIARYGMKGEDVKKLQDRLIKAGFLKGKADGIFGKATYTAVKSFQEISKLEVDGIIGGKTMEALKKYKPAKKKPPLKLEDKVKTPQTTKKVKSTPVKPPYSAPRKPERPKGETGVPANWRPIQLESTAYTRFDEGCTDFTFRGNYVRRGLVAVDPDIIPLGTKMYVPEYGYAVADDIGGAIQGYKIDLAMETLEEAFDYGRRHITAYIIS
ncbi:peptidoglycan-binding protein [Sporomusa malonica]|uniref:3D (Asp-Asp-Asp) domain-containing protein n=1 Tax=Sporomusa malonica TaxID=112901 RepID=A0A1W2D8R1_9FIRM|nr:peptidoglycan-binding protein [Sporomusa malonica]SMC93512.1 3D (Asp-Asp-Asp) domain-containing protein [Sporomusa malonica]